MLKLLFAGLLIVVAPASVLAQSTKSAGETAGSNTGTSAGSPSAAPGPSGNLNNPQAQANQAGQPANAGTTPGSGDANSIPTPTLSNKSTALPNPASPNAKR